ncbi:MAG TPA: ATP-binding protein [Edaphobacter sp.]|nr:ATP-binding protein [Edaphobacter sp.]
MVEEQHGDQAEETLRRSEKRYRAVFESVEEGVCILERLPLRPNGQRDYRYVAMNFAMQRMFGIADLTGQSVRDNFPNEVEAWYDDYDYVLETGKSIRFERESVPQRKYLEMFIARMEDGDSNALLVVLQDITARKQAEAILRENEQSQAFLLRFSDTIRTLKEADAIATTATRMVAEHFQVDRCFISRISRSQGKAWIEHETCRPGLVSIEGEVDLADFPETMRIAETMTLISHDVPSDPALTERDKSSFGALEIGAFVAAVLREGERNYIWDLVIASSKPRSWSPATVSLLDELAERTWRAIEQAGTEKVLLQTEKLAAVGRLAASIAHEINNPLESVMNLLYLANGSDSVAEIRGYLEIADSELRRVAAITNQTLRFYRQSTEAREVTCDDLFESVLTIHHGRLKNARVIVEKRKRAKRAVRCFDGEIRQVLNNLVGNAIDAMSPKGGRLILRSRDGRDWKTDRKGIVLTVADTGTGISPQTLQRLFEAFYTTKGIGGTGLGLWVSEEIVSRHGGKLRVRSSQKEGRRGSVFTVFLPYNAVARV